jgi:hypothetical protein
MVPGLTDNVRKRLLRWASGIMLVLGIGHLTLLTVAFWTTIAGWAGRGAWAAVPLGLAGSDVEPTVESLRNKVVFWAGPGSFTVPLILLSLLIWHLAGRGTPVPAAIGWGLAAWCLVGGVLLVPSPFFAGIIAAALIIVAARTDARTAAPST